MKYVYEEDNLQQLIVNSIMIGIFSVFFVRIILDLLSFTIKQNYTLMSVYTLLILMFVYLLRLWVKSVRCHYNYILMLYKNAPARKRR